jgi:hypothetical protein
MITAVAIQYESNWEFPVQKKEWKTENTKGMIISCESNTTGQTKEFCHSSPQDFSKLDDQEKDGRIRLQAD